MPRLLKRSWDWHHTSIVGMFVLGLLYGACPIFWLAFNHGGSVNGKTLLPGLMLLVASAVTAFFKHPPGSIVEALQEGEDVGEDT